MTELIRASGPDRYFGGTIETFALPMGAFIVISLVLFYIYRRPHGVPRLKYLQPAHQVSFGTREPGTAGLISVASRPLPAGTPETGAQAGRSDAEGGAPSAEGGAPSAEGGAPSAEGETF